MSGPRTCVPGMLLGVDVGNSKTHVAAVTTDGELLAAVEGPGASPQYLGAAGSWEIVSALIDRACAEAAHRPVVAAAYAVAGVDFDFEQQAYEVVITAGPTARTVVWNDTFAVMRAGTDGPDGIAVVVGAGINCVGRYGGRSVRYPSLGTISGDWGGGGDVGPQALALACRAEDGRGAETVLRTAVPAHFGLLLPSEVTLAVHRGQVPGSRLRELARVALQAADDGDAVAVGLAHRQADEVVDMVRATAARLGVGPDRLPILMGGGILRAGCRVLDERIAAGLAALHPGAVTTLIPADPVFGAVLLAADRAGITLPDQARLAEALHGRFRVLSDQTNSTPCANGRSVE